jgi:hypothetical protein
MFQHSRQKLLKRVYERLIAPHESTLSFIEEEGLQRLCREKKYAHVTTDYTLVTEGYVLNCSISPIPKASFTGLLAIPISKRSPYLGLLNYK